MRVMVRNNSARGTSVIISSLTFPQPPPVCSQLISSPLRCQLTISEAVMRKEQGSGGRISGVDESCVGRICFFRKASPFLNHLRANFPSPFALLCPCFSLVRKHLYFPSWYIIMWEASKALWYKLWNTRAKQQSEYILSPQGFKEEAHFLLWRVPCLPQPACSVQVASSNGSLKGKADALRQRVWLYCIRFPWRAC